MRRHAAPMRLPWLQGRPSSSLSLQLHPRAGGFLGDDGDKTFEMSLDTFESEKHKQNMKIDEQCRLQWPYNAVYNSNSSARTLTIYTSTSMQGHNTKYNTIWIWTDLFQNNGHKKPASQRNKPTKQLQPRDLQTHFPGFFRFGCLLPRLPSKDGRGWLWMAYSILFTDLLFSPQSTPRARWASALLNSGHSRPIPASDVGSKWAVHICYHLIS